MYIDNKTNVMQDTMTADALSTAVVNAMRNWVYVRENIYLSVHNNHGKKETTITRDYLNLRLGMRVKLPDDSMLSGHRYAVVNRSLLELIGKTESEMWDAAYCNSRRDAEICSMAVALGLPKEDDDGEKLMFVAAVSYGQPYGASVICFNDLFRDFCNSIGEMSGLYLLPSSNEELLVLPISRISGKYDILELANMVRDVNASGLVDLSIQLDPVVYEYDLATDSVRIAGAATGYGL